MKFSINQKELDRILTVVLKGVSTRSTLPVLSGIYIEAKNGILTFQSTDLNLSIKHTAQALIEEEGEAVLPGKLFSNIVKNLPDAAVTFVFNKTEAEAKLVCEKANFKIKTLDTEDFPSFPQVEEEQTIVLPSQVFVNMVKKVSRVVAKDESKIILTGVLITLKENKLRMVATDSYRLALTEQDIDPQGTQDFEVVIEGSFLNDVASVNLEKEIKIAVSANQILIDCGEVCFINRRIEGNFPNYQPLISLNAETTASIKIQELQSSIKRVSLLGSDGSPIKLELNAADQTIKISSSAQDVGSAEETIFCNIEGQDTDIAFNSHFVLEGLSLTKEENINLEVVNSVKPGIFKTQEDNFLYLIMPVHVN